MVAFGLYITSLIEVLSTVQDGPPPPAARSPRPLAESVPPGAPRVPPCLHAADEHRAPGPGPGPGPGSQARPRPAVTAQDDQDPYAGACPRGRRESLNLRTRVVRPGRVRAV